YDGLTPLHLAVAANDIVAAKLLLEKGADPSICGRNPKGYESKPIDFAQAHNAVMINLLNDYEAKLHPPDPANPPKLDQPITLPKSDESKAHPKSPGKPISIADSPLGSEG